jgi:hypothetical protein
MAIDLYCCLKNGRGSGSGDNGEKTDGDIATEVGVEGNPENLMDLLTLIASKLLAASVNV